MRLGRVGLMLAVLAMSATPALAHFQEILPSTDRFGADSQTVDLSLVFTHPMQRGPTMDMARPVRFEVKGPAGETDLLEALTETPIDGKSAWSASYVPSEPGNYIFFVEPAPYWEAAEGKSIIHYSKVVVDAYDSGDGWAETVGLPVEIEPLIRH